MYPRLKYLLKGRQKMINPQYILSLRDFLPTGLQTMMAGELGVSRDYIKKVLGGNRGRDLKSEKAIEIARYIENYILSNGLEYLPPLDYLGVAIKIHTSRGSKKPYSEAIYPVFIKHYSSVQGMDLNILPS